MGHLPLTPVWVLTISLDGRTFPQFLDIVERDLCRSLLSKRVRYQNILDAGLGQLTTPFIAGVQRFQRFIEMLVLREPDTAVPKVWRMVRTSILFSTKLDSRQWMALARKSQSR